MSGLDVAAGVIAVVELSYKVTSLCVQYSRQAAGAKSSIARLAERVDQLRDTLNAAKRLLDGQHGPKLKASQSLRHGVDTCFGQMEQLEDRMKLGKGRKAMSRLGVRALSWPFAQKEIDRIIQDLTTSETTISLALQVDTAYV